MLDAIKAIVPPDVRLAIRKGSRSITGSIRVMPDFLIIGSQKCGTTSLYQYLVRHPNIVSASRKQMHFFDNNFSKGITWYRTHFPSAIYKYYYRQVHKQDFLTGEGTPYYIFHPLAAKRVSMHLPNAKFILMLRNPVSRTYSHYNHEVRKGFENLSFEEALEKEPERLAGEVEKMLADETYYSFSHQHHSYVTKSIYADQLNTWFNYFPKEQFLILDADDMYADPPAILKQIFSFLELPHWELKEYKNFNEGGYSKLDPTLRNRLIDLFKPHNQRLYDLLGRKFNWDK